MNGHHGHDMFFYWDKWVLFMALVGMAMTSAVGSSEVVDCGLAIGMGCFAEWAHVGWAKAGGVDI